MVTANIFISYWYIFIILSVFINLTLIFLFVSKSKQKAEKPKPQETIQTLILPMTANEAEKSVMHELYRKVAEYETVVMGRFARYLYHETDELIELEEKLKKLQDELKRIGHYEDGGYCFCSFLFIISFNHISWHCWFI